ncbi:putative peptidase A1 family protein [Lyophyllum shimeji]|uniref:Peptidase A1 family protein n=1 Tax=Lyophyllum shimeji TaxID=47721 RepID=A0A9P3UPC1_LYOSH|nr:putative peptidase A1 family protein [Lyophyllum shimeji]
MHFRFSALLAGVLLALSVHALPSPKPNPNPTPAPGGLVTLPLHRVEQRSNVHPLIAHQQNINRSQRRYARMTGRREPTTEELHENLRKRVLAVEGEQGLERRYNRIGVPKKSKTAGSGAVLASGAARNRKGKGQGNGRIKGNGKGIAAGGAAGAGAGAAAGASAGAAAGASAAAPDKVTPANQPSAANSLGLDIEANDVGYLATIQMGTPSQDFLILMDSGSADLWVGAENCQSQAGGGCGNHKFLGPQGSNTFQDTQTPFQVTYGTGQVSGSIVQDDIVVAGLALKGHTFGVATTESVEFSDNSTPFDGLMGLAQSTLSQQQTLTPIEAMAKAGLVKDAITSYKISRLADNKNDGEITFGGLDTTKFDQQTLVTLKNVNKQGFWEGAMDAVSVDGTDVGLQGRTAILDTGTTLIIAPAADAAAVHKNIQGAKSDGQGGFTVPCTTTASVALTFGGTTFAIDPRDIAFQPVDPANPNGDCISGISSGQIGGATEWLVGDVFLKNAYFSTDVTKNTVSLAKLV